MKNTIYDSKVIDIQNLDISHGLNLINAFEQYGIYFLHTFTHRYIEEKCEISKMRSNGRGDGYAGLID